VKVTEELLMAVDAAEWEKVILENFGRDYFNPTDPDMNDLPSDVAYFCNVVADGKLLDPRNLNRHNKALEAFVKDGRKVPPFLLLRELAERGVIPYGAYLIYLS